MDDIKSKKSQFTFFTDDLGVQYIIDISQIRAITTTGCTYIDENGETKYQSQLSVGSTWFQVNTEVLYLAKQLGIECK